MHSKDRSVNLLYTTFALLLSHLYDGNNQRKTFLLDYYLSTRKENIKGSTKIIDAFDSIPKYLQIKLARVLLCTPSVNLGFFGTPVEPLFLTDLQENKKDTLPKTLKGLKDKPYMNTYLKDVPKNEQILLEACKEFIAKNPHLTFFSINKHAISLAKTTKELLGIARLSIPRIRFAKGDFHSNLFANAFLTCEISIPPDLLEDIRQSYVLSFKNFIPLSVLYSLCYQTTLGVDLVLSVAKIGFVLGFRGSESERFSYIKQYRKMLGSYVSVKYNLRYDRSCEVLFHGSNVDESLQINRYTKKVSYFDTSYLLRKNNPYKKIASNGETLLTISRGTYIIDHNSFTYGQIVDQKKHGYTFPYEVRFLTPRTRMTASLKNSSFTLDKHQIRAFDNIVDENSITKPNTKKRKKIVDNRWQPIFDEYLKSDFSLENLSGILLKDVSYFQRIRPKLLQLKSTLGTKNLTSKKLKKIYYEGHDIEHRLDQIRKVDKDLFELYQDCISLWLQEFKNPLLPEPVEVSIRKLVSEKKTRVVCKQPILISIFESFANRIFQVIYQKINRDELNYAVSNYLPGLAVPLFTMERISQSLDKNKDFALCNMDVKSCFDNINLKHDNFIKRLDLSLNAVDKLVSKSASKFLRYVFKDYLYDNVIAENFVFTADHGNVPSVGSLPTGFVLSPALWLLLALPALLETEQHRRKGTLYAYDLCGDDFIAVSPRDMSEDVKEDICQPWFELANSLDLKFHFFKNYTDKRVHFDKKWEFLFEDRKVQSYTSAWINKFPARSIPVFHAGCILARKSYVETITSVVNIDGKLYCALNKRNRESTANFMNRYALGPLKTSINLVSRLDHLGDSKRLRDQVDWYKEQVQYMTGAQVYVGSYFRTGAEVQDALGDQTHAVRKRQRILQYNEEP
jgi:hypothetical protein